MAQLLLLISRAGIPGRSRAITSSRDMPRARNLLITLSMSFMPAFMLPMCRSVEIESGRKPSFMAGTAMRQRKLPPPWPDVEDHAALAAFEQAGFTWPDGSCSPRRPE